MALGVSPGDCSNNLLLESSPVGTRHRRLPGGLNPAARPQPYFVNGYYKNYGNITVQNGPMAMTQAMLGL